MSLLEKQANFQKKSSLSRETNAWLVSQLEMIHELLLKQLELGKTDPNAVAKSMELLEEVLDELDQPNYSKQKNNPESASMAQQSRLDEIARTR